MMSNYMGIHSAVIRGLDARDVITLTHFIITRTSVTEKRRIFYYGSQKDIRLGN
jgi:hypothetical protein